MWFCLVCGCCDEEGPPSDFSPIPRGEPTDFFWQRLRFAGFPKARAQMFMDSAGTAYNEQIEEELDDFGLLRNSNDICNSCLKLLPGKKATKVWVDQGVAEPDFTDLPEFALVNRNYFGTFVLNNYAEGQVIFL